MKLERIDKYISSQTEFSRKDIKKLILQKRITVDNEVITKSDIKIDIDSSKVKVNGKEISYKKNVYLILNKPKGYISATEDRSMKTVLDLVPEEFKNRELFPAGRLDKDTTGLMIITDDGEFVHDILAPKKHVSKKYEVTLDIPVTVQMQEEFAKGINLNDGVCKTAILEMLDTYKCLVTLTEGRYHQIKRMFGCFGAKVVELNRVSIGKLDLPINLEQGECRELTLKELELIKEK